MLSDSQNLEFSSCFNLVNTYLQPTYDSDQAEHEMYDMFLQLVIGKMMELKDDIMKWGTERQKYDMKNFMLIYQKMKWDGETFVPI